ncbi:putative pyridoxine 5'-phosphate oxidase superfamily flavin-nucleotide-binding protein [Actinoplanes tereljensis]|uniref:Pyridoxamine 5'-phosphate oxidase N-terminal domain-containing protein n=1 Tax=Paractinoplanes tereljensis TaxID=571912 RepID=A0A919TWQ1_9ACTN|nr:pyridoxamine 5'-phosphate oxidase family protein [Actinoplanes tereljensis]GIF23122.1 hypothetical protein Ate02nite_58520 [Actinoplanes tereljensis]
MTVFHWGELAVQAKAGLSARATAVSRLVQPVLPDGADDFLAQQYLLVVGAQADDGRLWASMFAGAPGFVSAPDDESVLVRARLAADDPVEPMTRHEGKLGLLAIDLRTRVRLRMNGTATPRPDGLRLAIDQSFPNCPKYIQRRSVAGRAEQGEAGPGVSALIAGADTFFVASVSESGDLDVSHRGGEPGFVEVLSPNRLRWPDYRGNGMLMTLGNITEDPRAALLFVDWATGTTLQLTGRAEVRWAEESGSRAVEFEIEDVVYRPGSLGIRMAGSSARAS